MEANFDPGVEVKNLPQALLYNNHLFEANDGDGGAGDHEADAHHEEEVKNLVLQ
jgi:hypothetical protein